MAAAVNEQLARVADAAGEILALDQRHHGHAGLETGKPQGEFGKQHQGDAEHAPTGCRDCAKRAFFQLGNECGWRSTSRRRDHSDHEVQRQVGRHQHDRDADRFLEAFEKDGAEDGEQQPA